MKLPTAKEIREDLEQSRRGIEALQSIGFPVETIRPGYEGPCPKCGGRDRFSLQDIVRLSFYCRICFKGDKGPTSGDIISTVRWWLDCDSLHAKKVLIPFTRFADGYRTEREHLGSSRVVAVVDDGRQGKESNDRQPVDFAKLLERFIRQRKAVTANTGELPGSEAFGLTEEIADALGVGYDLHKFSTEDYTRKKAIVFPMRDGSGGVVGLSYRSLDSDKKERHFGSKNGPTYSLDLLNRKPSRICLCEGQTDLVAALAIGIDDAVAMPSVTGKNARKMLLDFVGVVSPDEIVIVADGDDAGVSGARALASHLVDVVPVVKIITPPEGIKDLRAWVQAGADRKTVERAIAGSLPFERAPGEKKDDSSPPGAPDASTTADDAAGDDADDEQSTTANKPSGPARLKPRTLGELIEKHPEMRPPVIAGILRKGETMNLIASAKRGKSFLAGQLAWCVASGVPWLGHAVTEGRVLILDNELHPETIVHRLDIIGRELMLPLSDHADRIHVLPLRGEGIDIHAIESRLEQIEAGFYSLVLLDALYRTLPEGANENDNAAMMAIYNRLDSYAKLWDCSIVVVHHASKGEQSGKAVTDVGSGAGSISRAADTHIVIRPHEDDSLAVMECVTRSFKSPEPRSIRFEFPLWSEVSSKPQLKRPGRQSDDQQKATDRADSEALLAAIPLKPGSIQQIHLREKFDFGVSRFNRLIGGLVRDGSVSLERKTGEGRKMERVFYSRTQNDSESIPN